MLKAGRRRRTFHAEAQHRIRAPGAHFVACCLRERRHSQPLLERSHDEHHDRVSRARGGFVCAREQGRLPEYPGHCGHERHGQGTCPGTFDVRATDFWEVLEAPDRIGVEYLFLLSDPIVTLPGLSLYEMPTRLAWQRQLG